MSCCAGWVFAPSGARCLSKPRALSTSRGFGIPVRIKRSLIMQTNQFSGRDSLLLEQNTAWTAGMLFAHDQSSETKLISGHKGIAGVIHEEMVELSVCADGLPNGYWMRRSTYKSG